MLTDIDLKNSVLAELSWDPSVTAAHIGVTADAGVISLTGHVDSYDERHAADLAARRVKGVKAVVQDIEVRLPFDHPGGDAAIARAALDRLAWHVTDPDYKIQLEVERGWITLTGQVAWHFQRNAVESELLRLQGVVGIDNDITIKPKVSVANIRDDINHALHRSWFFDPKTINVSANGGVVHLSGTARSLHDRSVAAITAWAASGVTQVENHITVV